MGNFTIFVIVSALRCLFLLFQLYGLVVHYCVLNNTGLIMGPVRVAVQKVAEKEKRGGEKKRLVWCRNHLTTSPGN